MEDDGDQLGEVGKGKCGRKAIKRGIRGGVLLKWLRIG